MEKLNDTNKIDFDIKRRCRSVYRRLIQKSNSRQKESPACDTVVDCFQVQAIEKEEEEKHFDWRNTNFPQSTLTDQSMRDKDQYCMPTLDDSGKEIYQNFSLLLPTNVFHTSILKSTKANVNDFEETLYEDINDNEQYVNSLTDLTLAGAELFSTNEYEASLLCYHNALIIMERNFSTNYYHMARLSYICGQLCEKSNSDLKLAANYYSKELAYTLKFNKYHNSNHEANICTLECLRSLAKLYYDIGEFDIALKYYQDTLIAEQTALTKLMNDTTACCRECNNNKKKKTTYNNSQCTHHINPRAIELKHQLQETKKCIGRIHFLNGNLEIAFHLSSIKIQD